MLKIRNMKSKRNILILFSLILVSNLSQGQVAAFYSVSYLDAYYRNYAHKTLKTNKVKSVEITKDVFEEDKKLNDKYRAKLYLDSLGKVLKYELYSNKDKIKKTSFFVNLISQKKLIEKIKNMEFVYVCDDEINDMNLIKTLSKNKIKEVEIINDSFVTYYNIKRNNLQLLESYKLDTLSRDKQITFVKNIDNVKDTIVINYDFDSENKVFKSFLFFNKEKILVSTGVLNENKQIIKENFFWLRYVDINNDNIKDISPIVTIEYAVDQNGLIHMHKETSKMMNNFSFTISNNKISDKDKTEIKLRKEITKMRYEYYK